MMRGLVVAALVLVFGAARVPVERDLAGHDRSGLDLSLREQIGQLAFVAALSGFRSIVADVVFIQAHVAWERTEWARVLLLFRQATTLQPHSLLFWDMAAWHMAWNASVAAMNDRTLSANARLKKQRECIALGKDFLERGIRNNPDKPQLYEAMARLYQQKYNDHLRASEYFARAASLPGAMGYDRRFAAYELSYCEGREREAYQRLRELYDIGQRERLPTLITRLKFLEDKLGIPQDQRIPDR
jgi:tetratricopeptide (TPR) repeat protein